MSDKPVVQQWGYTELELQKTNFLWKINNFSYMSVEPEDLEEKIESPLFSIESSTEPKWFIRLYPNGVEEYEDSIALYLCSKSTSQITVDAQFTLSILNDKEEKVHELTKKTRLKKDESDGFENFIEKSILFNEANSYLKNDVLAIFCELTLIKKTISTLITKPVRHNCLEAKALDSFQRFYETKELCDFMLIAPCKKQILAHKFILAARSPVFAAMFKDDMKEKKLNAVEINDIDYDSLREMLRFMYSATVKNLDKSATGILAAAQKYQIDGLKEICEDKLFQNLNIENAVEVLTLAYHYDLNHLKAQTGRFITVHAEDIIDTVGFNNADESELLAEIIRIMVSK